jgi:hypothetical protein
MIRMIGCLMACLCILGCNGDDNGVDDEYPDHTFVWEATGQLQTLADATFLQERPTQYRTTETLPDLDVRSLALIGSDLWAGTATGLARYDSTQDKFTSVPLTAGALPVVDLAEAALLDGRLVVALADRVELHDPSGTNTQLIDIPQVVLSVATDGTDIYIGTEVGLGKIETGAFSAITEVPAVQISDIAVDSTYVWLATATGLIRFDGSQTTTLLPDEQVRAVFSLPAGGVLAGYQTGAALVGTQSDRTLEPGVGALPHDDITAVFASGDLMAFGHGIGATVVQGDFDHVDYYHSQRWIPAQAVTDVALDGDRRWIASSAGITRIELEETTLLEKAALFDSYNDDFWRLDFVSCDGRLDDPWDPLDTMVHHDHDNDGLWTQMQIVAWSYAAAATGDDSYCDKARRAMGMMMEQIDIPAISFQAAGMERGFVTRSLVRDDEGQVYTSKETQDNWHLVEDYDGHDYYWKDDTSSDETDGHFFGYPVFYDLCAKDDAEREMLAEHAGALARYIVEGGFKLIDLDGERTRHGHWDPETCAVSMHSTELSECMQNYPMEDCAFSTYGGGWLNGMQILGHLLAAYHMTGDTYFYDAYEYLITEHKYDRQVEFDEEVWTVTKRNIANHSDHELAFLAYHTLIRYEPDEERRQRWIQSMLDMYQWELLERNPLWSAIVAGFVTDGYYLDEAVGTLREWPEDWREFRADNSHRKDAIRDSVPDRFGDPQFTTVLPYDEMCFTKWNGNPYQVVDCGDGRAVQAPWPWLLPYWMYRYHGVIQ